MDLDAAKRRRGGGPVGLQLAAVRGRGLLSAFLLSDGQPSCAGDEAVRLGGPRSFLPLPVSCVGLPLNLLRWTCRSRARLFVADAPPIMAVSRAYGARQCGTHTPTTLRPGLIAEAIRDAFAAAGYPLLTDYPATRGMIEVYPHPALVELAQADRRLPYKISRMRSYWPIDNPSDRRLKLLHVWRRIVDLLQHQISGVCDALPLPDAAAPAVQLKAFEDRLDAVICAWVAICALSLGQVLHVRRGVGAEGGPAAEGGGARAATPIKAL